MSFQGSCHQGSSCMRLLCQRFYRPSGVGTTGAPGACAPVKTPLQRLSMRSGKPEDEAKAALYKCSSIIILCSATSWRSLRAIATGTGAVGPLSLSAVAFYVPRLCESLGTWLLLPCLMLALMHVRSRTTPSQALRTEYNVIACKQYS